MTYWQNKGREMLTPKRGRPHKWPWHELEPGETRTVETDHPQRARAAAYSYHTSRGWTMRVRIEGRAVVVTRVDTSPEDDKWPEHREDWEV